MVVLALCANEEGLSQPTVPVICQMSGLGPRQVQRVLRQVEADGHISLHVQGRGRGHASCFLLHEKGDTAMTPFIQDGRVVMTPFPQGEECTKGDTAMAPFVEKGDVTMTPFPQHKECTKGDTAMTPFVEKPVIQTTPLAQEKGVIPAIRAHARTVDPEIDPKKIDPEIDPEVDLDSLNPTPTISPMTQLLRQWQASFSEKATDDEGAELTALLRRHSIEAIKAGIVKTSERPVRNRLAYITSCAKEFDQKNKSAPPRDKARSYTATAPEPPPAGYRQDVEFAPPRQAPTFVVAHDDDPEPEPLDDLDLIWRKLLPELASMPPMARDALIGSRLRPNGILAGEAHYMVEVNSPDTDLQWLNNRAEAAIRKTLASALHKRVHISFTHSHNKRLTLPEEEPVYATISAAR